MSPFSLRMLAAGLVAAAMAGFPMSAAAAADEEKPRIYRWIDADGIVHYTTDLERVPTSLRGRIAAPPPQAPEAAAAPVRGQGPDLWLERDRPPDASEVEVIGESGFAADDPARQARIDEIDARIETLRESIAADEEALKLRVIGPNADPLAADTDDEMRTVAARLPGLLAELRSLRDERATLEAR